MKIGFSAIAVLAVAFSFSTRSAHAARVLDDKVSNAGNGDKPIPIEQRRKIWWNSEESDETSSGCGGTTTTTWHNNGSSRRRGLRRLSDDDSDEGGWHTNTQVDCVEELNFVSIYCPSLWMLLMGFCMASHGRITL